MVGGELLTDNRVYTTPLVEALRSTCVATWLVRLRACGTNGFASEYLGLLQPLQTLPMRQLEPRKGLGMLVLLERVGSRITHRLVAPTRLARRHLRDLWGALQHASWR